VRDRGSQGLDGLPGRGLLGTSWQSSSKQSTQQTVGNLSSSEPREALSTHPKGPDLSNDEAFQQKHYPGSGIQHKQAILTKEPRKT